MRTTNLTGLLLLAAAAVALPGCGSSVIPNADPVAAREGLVAALDAWQSGEAAEALARRTPPIHVADDDWHAGARLVKYELAGEGDFFGANYCCPVSLSLQTQSGRSVQKKIYYSVGTSPVLTVVREDRRRGR
jgi:hypothetical protein